MMYMYKQLLSFENHFGGGRRVCLGREGGPLDARIFDGGKEQFRTSNC